MKVSRFTIAYLAVGAVGLAFLGIHYFMDLELTWDLAAYLIGAVLVLADLVIITYKRNRDKNTKA